MDFASNGSYGDVYASGDKTYSMVRARGKLVADAVSEHNNSYKNLWFLIFLIVFGLCFFGLELL